MSQKAITGKAYGSIPHLPGSKFGNREDKGCAGGAASMLTTKRRGPQDWVTVTEKLDGSCVAVINDNYRLIAINKAGYPAVSSQWVQHRLFHLWVEENWDKIARAIYRPGDRICGEWLAQAHGTRYDLADRSPFVAFDIFQDGARASHWLFEDLCKSAGIQTAPLLWEGPEPCSVEEALARLGDRGHYGAIDPAEGCVWRLEREGKFEAIAKYVRPEKDIGCYLPEVSGHGAVWNLPKVRG